MTENGHMPEAPDGLGEAGRETWAEAWQSGWMNPADRASIAHLCRLEDEAQQIAERVEADGVVTREAFAGPKGDVLGERWVVHPLVGELRKLDPQLQSLRLALGLTPESRAKFALERVERRPDELDELIERRRKRLEQQRRRYEAGKRRAEG